MIGLIAVFSRTALLVLSKALGVTARPKEEVGVEGSTTSQNTISFC